MGEIHDMHDPDTGQFVLTITDDDLWQIWVEENASSSRTAKRAGINPRHVRRRIAKIREQRDKLMEPDVSRAGHLEQLLASVPIDGPQGAKVKQIDVKLWGVAAKDNDGNLQTQGLDGITARYKLADTHAALDVEPRESKIVAYRATGVTDPLVERIFIIGDLQIGWWAVRDPDRPKVIRFEPFHDEAAIDCMFQALALYRPNRVVIVGDMLDFPQLSKFQQEPEWGQTMQAAIQEAYDLLCKLRKTVGDDCEIDFIPGNHETRMTRAIVNNNPALYNLTRPGEQWPVYSVPSLLKFEQLGITCAAEYPSGEVWLAQRRGNIAGLVVTHADPKKREMRADAIHGHLVMPALETRQVFYEDGPVTYTRMCVSGCGNYSDTGDKVRLTRTNTPSGRARMSSVPSFGTVDVDRKTGLRHYGLHLIHQGATHFHGKIVRSHIHDDEVA